MSLFIPLNRPSGFNAAVHFNKCIVNIYLLTLKRNKETGTSDCCICCCAAIQRLCQGLKQTCRYEQRIPCASLSVKYNNAPLSFLLLPSRDDSQLGFCTIMAESNRSPFITSPGTLQKRIAPLLNKVLCLNVIGPCLPLSNCFATLPMCTARSVTRHDSTPLETDVYTVSFQKGKIHD